MKPIDTPKDKNGVQISGTEANEETAPSVQEEAPEKIDFSNVVIEPLFRIRWILIPSPRAISAP